MKVSLTPLGVEYQTAVFNTIVDAGRWIATQGVDQWPMKWLEGQRLDLNDAVANGYFYGVFDNQTLAAVVRITPTPEAVWGWDPTPSLYVHKLAIVRDYAGRGLGSQILQRIETMAGSEKRLRLDCVVANQRLRQYYRENGFQFLRVVNNGAVDLALFEK